MTRILYATVFVLMAIFTLMILFFRITTGSFEEAGAHMDRLTGQAAVEIEDAAIEAVEETDRIIEDIADGSDDTPN